MEELVADIQLEQDFAGKSKLYETKCFWWHQWSEPPLSKFYAIPWCSTDDYQGAEPGISLSASLLRELLRTTRLPLSFLFSRLGNSVLSPSSKTCLLVLLQSVANNLNLPFRTPGTVHHIEDEDTPGLNSGRITSFVYLATLCLMNPKMQFALVATRSYCWLMLSCCHQQAGYLSAELLFSHSYPSLWLCPALLPPKCSTWFFSVVELHVTDECPML